MSNLAQRLMVAAVALPLVTGAAWAGGPWFAALVVAAAVLAAWEFWRISAAAGVPAWRPALLAAAVLLPLAGPSAAGATLTLLLLAALAWGAVRYERGGAGTEWLWTAGGMLYTGWLPLHFLALRGEPQGREWVLLALLATVVSDTAAYATGRLLGRRRLAPRISPGKTWEGATGSLVATTVLTPFLALALGLPAGPGMWALGAAVSVFAQTGDLAESMLKRSAGVKDAGGLLPGHGGILDRIDSLVFVGPLVYYGIRWLSISP